MESESGASLSTSTSYLGDEKLDETVTTKPLSSSAISVSSDGGDSPEPGKGDAVATTADDDIIVGDHVYKWCSFVGIPFAYQHHAIVLDVLQKDDSKKEDSKKDDSKNYELLMLKVVDFSNWSSEDSKQSSSSASSSCSSSSGFSGSKKGETSAGGGMRIYETKASEWRKVCYQADFWKRSFSWSGTSTSTSSDPPALVLARVHFLLDNPRLIPRYDSIYSNCECVALWCKTGTWCTVQAASWLSTAAAGQVKSAATMAGTVAATQVPVTTVATVPAAGVWGWLGFTTQQTVTTHVSLAATQPLLLPAIVAFGVITFGVPAVSLVMANRHWKKMTEDLNREFWENAVSQPEIFVECIVHWSTHLGS